MNKQTTNAIKRLRKSGLSRGDIARTLDVTRQAVGYWENGQTTPGGREMGALVSLAESRGITLLASDFVTPANRKPTKRRS